MDLMEVLHVDELSHGLASLSMFPYFDLAHYIVSVMALREQPGALEVSRVSPTACWFSSMLFCFGGAVLSSIMLAEPPVSPLSNGSAVLLASIVWYLIFYCPKDLVYSYTTKLPLRVPLTAMKEVTRTWKVVTGVTMAHHKYQDSLLVMIAIGWTKGAGGGMIRNFEQLVRGVWRPETNALLKMTYPTKISLIGSVLFSLQQTQYLPIHKHHLMLIYTIFIVVNQSRMMLTGSSASPFAAIEQAFYNTFFTANFPYAALTAEEKTPCTDNGTSDKPATKESKESNENGAPRKSAPPSPGRAKNGAPKAKEESEQEEEETSCKKTN